MLHRKCRGLRGAAALLVGACLSAGFFLWEAPKVQAKDSTAAISVGIDVSVYQGDIDWKAAAAAGVRFAFVRVGTMKSGIDKKFHQNMTGAAEAGVKTGVYIYSYAANPQQAAAEAVFVLAAIQNYTVSMPVVIDIEDTVQKTLPPAEQSLIADTFCAIVESAGYYPMVYGSKYWFQKKLGPISYDKWVAQYGRSCDIEDAAFWQATSEGAIPGIAGNVDIDYQYKDLSAQIIPYGFLYRKGSYFFYENYKMKVNSFVAYDGGIYYVNEAGCRVSGLYQVNGSIYLFDGNGRMLTGFQNLAGGTYYFDSEGKMKIGLTRIGEQYYLFDEQGRMYKGWTGSEFLYYFHEDGHMAVGLSLIGEKLYYFDEAGHLYTGWLAAGEDKLYFSPDGGAMAHGWVNDGTGVYYLDEAGRMQTGIITVDGAAYSMGSDGRMQLGWQDIGGAEFYFDPATGKMLTGWQQIGDQKFYLGTGGAKERGMINDGKGVYYLDMTDGHLVTNSSLAAGDVLYLFDAEGRVSIAQ